MIATAKPSAAASPADRKQRNIEAIFPLRSTQKPLMLFASKATDPGFLQVRFSLHGDLEFSALRKAWDVVVHRHSALRMSVHSVPGQEPMIVVRLKVTTPWRRLDWRGSSTIPVSERLTTFLAKDRLQGLDLASSPALRMALIQIEDKVHKVVLSCHHMFLDGWSTAIVINDLLAAYGSLCKKQIPNLAPLTCSYRDYLVWLKRQDRDETRAFWQHTLKDVASARKLRLEHRNNEIRSPSSGYIETAELLDKSTFQQIKAACMSNQIPPNALIKGAWAILLGTFQETDDVVFGATVAGRPADIDGIESLVGFFSNSIPVRVRIEPSQPVGDWLRKLRDEQLSAHRHEYADLNAIQTWLDLPGNAFLFESLLVVENFPWANAAQVNDLELTDFHSGLTSTYPVTLSVIPGDIWSIIGAYDSGRFSPSAVADSMGLFAWLLPKMLEDPKASVSLLTDRLRSIAAESFVIGDHGAGQTEHDTSDAPQREAVDAHVAPRNEYELRLAKIWEETLGISSIGVTENYFELGGTSIAAVRIFSAIEARFDEKLPLATLLEKPTIEQLATGIKCRKPAPWSSLGPIQAGGDKPPRFCVHAGGGHVLFYRHLAKRLGHDQPVFGLQPLGLDGERPPMRNIEQMALHYVDEMLSAQPTGPYHLLGYCIGATVGLEITRELERRGEQVAFLIALDSGFYWGPTPRAQQTIGGKITANAELIREIAHTDGILHVPRRAARKLLRSMTRYWKLNFADAASRRQVWLDIVEEACKMAFRTYIPRPCNAPITLIRTAEYVNMEDKTRHLKWRDMTPALDVQEIPAGHETVLLEPEVRYVAQIINDRIETSWGIHTDS